MRVLVACEESQRVCIEFRKLGHEAYSCDVIDPSGGHPEWHIKEDALEVINPTVLKNHYEGFMPLFGIQFYTMDGKEHVISGKWDLIIAHPPCTYLTNVATRSFSLRVTSAEKVTQRWEKRAKAAIFFLRLALANCDRIAVENPVGFMSRAYRKPDQYIEPWMFATGTDDTENYHGKKTCLWLKGLPKLRKNGIIKEFNRSIYGKYSGGKNKTWEDIVHKSDTRSKTFPGIARAMAEQWGRRIWVDCKIMLPIERKEGIGTVSDTVEVLLDTGEEDEDWLINHKWVLHCKLDSGGYPVKWRKKSGECTGSDEA